MSDSRFRTSFGERVFRLRYANSPYDTWDFLVDRLVDDVCGTRGGTLPPLMSKGDRGQLKEYVRQMMFIPGGRYLYYAGREVHFFNNCFCLRAEEDTREEWGDLLKRASDCLMSGGGIGVDYSRLRGFGKILKRTGGTSSGPIPLMQSVNEVGRNVMQGGSRRSAIYASLNWQHEDIQRFLTCKDWPDWLRERKFEDFNTPAPMDMTNISINWDTEFCENYLEIPEGQMFQLPKVWNDSVRRMCKTGEPGHSYNFYENEEDTLRNACCEFTSEDDSDVCNLGSINLANISSIDELKDVVCLASKFLICGTLRGDVPYEKVVDVREANRKIGLGLMGVHEWLLKRGYKYGMTDELRSWLGVYADESERSANEHCDRFFLNRPKKYRAVAPAGTIGILAGTTTGIEPLYAVAYKRGCIEGGTTHTYEYVIDGTARTIIDNFEVKAESIETAGDLARDPARRIAFQADVQEYVDMAISSTLNLPAWGTEYNNEDTVDRLSSILAYYAPRLRGVTAYPDGARGGQPLTEVPYSEALGKEGVVYEANEATCSGGICSL